MAEPPFDRVAIWGVGLLGGSLGLALRRRFPGTHVRGLGRDPARLESARTLGAVDDFATEPVRALRDRALVVLATPIEHILASLGGIAELLSPGTVVTDVGSTKRAICERAEQRLPHGIAFIGGHPLAGKEVGGIEQADAALFEGAPWVLCPRPDSAAPLARLRAMVEALGARPIELDPEQHDRRVAWISHLPQLLSTALALAVDGAAEDSEGLHRLAGTGFRDMVRLAGSPYE